MRIARISGFLVATVPTCALIGLLVAYPLVGKPAIPAAMLLLGVVALLVGAVLLRTARSFPANSIVLTPLPLACVAFVSFLVNKSPSYVVFGTISEIGTVASYVLLPIVTVLASLTPRRYIPYALSAVLLTICASTFILGVPQTLSIDADTRPSLRATEYIAAPGYLGSLKIALIGEGPRSFPQVWNKNRSMLFNNGPLWNVTPEFGYSTAATVGVELGILGLCAFFLVPIAVLISLWLRRPLTVAMVLSAGIVALVYGASALYPVDVPILVMGASALGWYARLVSEVPEQPPTVNVALSRMRGALLVLIGIASVWVGVWQAIGASFSARADSVLRAGEKIEAEVWYGRAADAWGSPYYEREASRVSAENALSRLSLVVIPPTPEEIIQHFDRALSLANLAVRDNPKRYELWVYRASLYVSLIQYKFEDAFAHARADISEAEELAPSTPEVPYVRALLEIKEGNIIAAREALLTALALKPDYAEAKNLLTELQSTPR